VTRRWQAQAALYRWIAREWPALDWSNAAALGMFAYESRGLALADPWRNGFFVGKHWLDWQITEWRLGIREGTTTRHELRTDATLPADAVARV
jgi:glucose/arabinose dehydrogenase